MQGIVLERLGHSVHILERHNEPTCPSQGAGITTKEHVQEYFMQHEDTLVYLEHLQAVFQS